VRLAGSRRSLEQKATARVAAELVAERPVREEDLERARDFLEHDVEPSHVVEPNGDLLG
jgi:hypothetical protein